MQCGIAEAGCAEGRPSWRKGPLGVREGWGSLSQAWGMKDTCFRWDVGCGRPGASEAGGDCGKRLPPPSRESACFVLSNLFCISSQTHFSWSFSGAISCISLAKCHAVGSGQLCRQNGLNHTTDLAVGGLWDPGEEGCRWIGALEKSPPCGERAPDPEKWWQGK